MAWLVDVIVDGFLQSIDIIFDLLKWCLSFIVRIFNVVMSWLESLIPPSVIEYFEGLQEFIDQLDNIIDNISYFVPIWGYMTEILAVAAICYTIRSIRWAMAVIPRAFTGVD